MNCTKCKQAISKGQPYARTKKGPHHFKSEQCVTPVAAAPAQAQPQPDTARSDGQAKAVFEGLLDDIEREAWEDGSERAVYLGTVKRFIAEAYEAGQAAQAQAPTPATPDYPAILERERSLVADGVHAVKKAISYRDWLTEGRGPYEWDDDRWHGEFAAAISEILAALKPLERVAGDLSNCPTKWEDIQKARAAESQEGAPTPTPPPEPPMDEFQAAWAKYDGKGIAGGWERIAFICGYGAGWRDCEFKLREAAKSPAQPAGQPRNEQI